MDLFRLYAYAVEPIRTTEHGIVPSGGRVPINAELTGVVENSIEAARFDRRTVVDFQVNQETRTNDVRDMILNFGFEEEPEAGAAGSRLARRLANSMDRRSKPCLFILAAKRENGRRQVTLWSFPRDSAFQFRSDDAVTRVSVLTDIFSQTSVLRKAAFLEGRRLRNEFLSGRVLDFQAGKTWLTVANFWVLEFLQCGFAIRAEAGTRLLARTIRDTHDSCEDPDDKEQIFSAVLGVARSPRTRWSLEEFAYNFLQGRSRDVFFEKIPNVESRTSQFDFQREIFESALQFRVFTLTTGVFVSSPIGEVGQSVNITGERERRLSCEGIIADEKLRTRHA